MTVQTITVNIHYEVKTELNDGVNLFFIDLVDTELTENNN